MDERELSKEQEPEEITTEMIIDACRTVLLADDIEFMIDMEPDEALEYLMSVLPEYGIENPDAYLAERGLAYTDRIEIEQHDLMNKPSRVEQEYTAEEAEQLRQELEERQEKL
jgi:hypothetical protein